MRIPRPQWLERRRRRVQDPLTRAANGELDTIRPHAYEISDDLRDRLQREVDAMVGRLLPGAIDAYTGHALDEWIDARAEQVVQQLRYERDEQQAVSEALIGLAREEVARTKAAYQAHLARAHHAREAQDETYRRLTGKNTVGPFIELPLQPESHDVHSTLGQIDSGPDWGAGSKPDAGTPVDPEPDPDDPDNPDDKPPGRPADSDSNNHRAGYRTTPINNIPQPHSFADSTEGSEAETEEERP